MVITEPGCEKTTINYGTEFPFHEIRNYTTEMGPWEISKVSYEFSLQARDIFFINADTGFIVGNAGRIFKTTDSGENWRRVNAGTSLNLVSVFFLNDRVGYASSEGPNCPWRHCSKGSYLLKTTDCGETWTKILFPEYYRILSLKFFDENQGVAIIVTKGQSDSLMTNVATSANGGSSWKISDREIKAGVEDLFFRDDIIFIQGRHQQLYKSPDNGITWDTIYTPVVQNNSIRYFYFINENIGFSDVMTGVYQTTDGGDSWTEVNFPFPYPDPLYFYNENEGFRIKGTYIITNGASSPTDEGSIFYLTPDGGVTWTVGTFDDFIDMSRTHFPTPGTGFGFRGSDFYRFNRRKGETV